MLLAAADSLARHDVHGGRFFFPLLLLLLLGGLAGWLIRRRRPDGTPPGQGSPMITLQERFARGEIDREEFDHRSAVLVGADVIPPAPAPTEPPAQDTGTQSATPDTPDGIEGDR